jgi:hypothetical protein
LWPSVQPSSWRARRIAGRADDAQGLPCAIRSDWGSGQAAIPGTSAHAATWLWLCPGERGPRHTGATGLARSQEHPAHGALHRAGAGSVQGFLAMMMRLEKLLSTCRPWRVLGQSANASSGSGRRGFWQEVSMTSRPRRTKSFMFSARVIRSPHQRGRAASANIRSANTHSPS